MPDLTTPISQALLHPPLTVLSPFLQPELLQGNGSLPRWLLGEVGHPIHGVLFTLNEVPPQLGRTFGAHPEWILPLAKIYYHAYLRTAVTVISRVDEMHGEELLWLADNLGGPTVEYNCLPGVKLAWSYLIWTG